MTKLKGLGINLLIVLGIFALLFPWTLFKGEYKAVYAQSTTTQSGLTSYSGVMINGKSVLLRNATQDYGRLSNQQLVVARRSATLLPQNVRMKSNLRCVSLNRLEKTIADNRGIVTEEMRFLAGIQRIKYVFYFPESKDIVVAGPAEGWYPGLEGVMVGESTHKPVCELQDLVVALRAYAPNAKEIPVVGCSIDPTEEGNARLQQFIKQFGRMDGDQNRRMMFINGLRQSLGMQQIRVDGISPNTHAAVVMVSADYRMKLMGIGVEQSPVPMNTFISMVNPSAVAKNALFRWFFVPDYNSVVLTEDKTGMELVGSGVKLVAEDELVSETGQRTRTGKADKASSEFAKSFTAAYPKLAEKAMVYAQLRNFIDMLVCAAHLDKENVYEKAEWKMEFFGDESKFAVQTVKAPTMVEPVVNGFARNGQFVAPIGGGVSIEAEIALKDGNAKTEEKGEITNVKNGIKLDLKPGQWWWD